MAGRLYLGTSGFAYEEWRHGAFYPKRLPAARMLRHYASVFRSVEINYTFRTMPTEAAIAGWREQTPDGFRFALKANQRITHMRRLHGAGPVLDEFTGLARLLGDRLGPVLFQLPPTLPYDAGLLTAFIDQLPDGLAAAFEFRHESWAAARPLLAQRGIALCVTETDETAVADDELSWRPFGYLRLRRQAYSDEQLAAWAQRIDRALAAGSDVYCYFKHEDSAAGPRMARRLGARIESPHVFPRK